AGVGQGSVDAFFPHQTRSCSGTAAVGNEMPGNGSVVVSVGARAGVHCHLEDRCQAVCRVRWKAIHLDEPEPAAGDTGATEPEVAHDVEPGRLEGGTQPPSRTPSSRRDRN